MKAVVMGAIAGLCLASAAHAGEQKCQGALRRPASSFTILGDGSEVMDPKTKLIWRRCIEGQTWTGETCRTDDPRAVNPGTRMTYAEAQRFAAEQSSADRLWRIPTFVELDTVREPDCYNPSFNLDIFPTSPAWSSDGFFWTSTPEAGGLTTVSAIGTSDAHETPEPGHLNHVRLVRTVKP